MARKDEYALDYTFAPAKALSAIADAYGTPVFVYDRATLEQRHRLVCDGFSWNPGFRQFFPVCAADHPEILRILLEAGSGLLCGSGAELKLARLAGATGENLLFHSCFPGYEEWEMAIWSGATIILDHPDQLEELRRDTYGDRVLGLRLSADGCVTLSGQILARGHSKFGMLETELRKTARLAVSRGFRKLGLYMMASANVYQPGYYAALAKALLKLALLIQQETGVQVCWCNLGGGLSWDAQQAHTLDIGLEAQKVREVWQQVTQEQTPMAFYTELGRYVAMPAGILLTRVRGIKRHIWSIVGLDASVSCLPKAAASYIQYHVSALGRYKLANRETYHLVGPTPDAGDIFEGNYILPPLETGDILVFHGAGAYGQTLSNTYRGTLRCPEVLLDRDGPRLISRRGTLEDCTAFLQGNHQ